MLNSGCANAATGERGEADAEAMCAGVAAGLGCEADEVLVCSTGLIGYELPMKAVDAGLGPLVAGRSDGADAAIAAAEAIRTTDTRRKDTVVRGRGFVVGGMGKGAAMLAPNMATMLAVLTTDAEVDPDTLAALLRAGVAGSFNAITIDGATSTNDTVILLASGSAGPVAVDELETAVADACDDLATQMVADAEGHTKVVRVTVNGAASDTEAAVGARKVAESQLVKCSWYGQDPYWGRIASELGSAGIDFDPDRLQLRYGDHLVADKGVAVPHDGKALSAYLSTEWIEVSADLGLGSGHARLLTNDLTYGYIDENKGTS